MIDEEYIILKEWGKPLEDIRYGVYTDSEGYYTIGPGILVDARKGGGLTKGEVMLLFSNRLNWVKFSLARTYDWYNQVDEVRRAVITSMAYQVGDLEHWPKFLNCMAMKDYLGAAKEMLDSKVAREQAPERWKEQAEMMRTGQWP